MGFNYIPKTFWNRPCKMHAGKEEATKTASTEVANDLMTTPPRLFLICSLGALTGLKASPLLRHLRPPSPTFFQSPSDLLVTSFLPLFSAWQSVLEFPGAQLPSFLSDFIHDQVSISIFQLVSPVQMAALSSCTGEMMPWSTVLLISAKTPAHPVAQAKPAPLCHTL